MHLNFKNVNTSEGAEVLDAVKDAVGHGGSRANTFNRLD